MEETDLKDFFNYFKKSFYYFLSITLSVFLIGSIYTFFIQKPLYQSRATVILGGDQAKTITQNEININKNLVDTYAEVVKSHRVLDRVKTSLESEGITSVENDYTKLSKKISVSTLKDTEIIEIKVTDKDAANSAKIADTTSKVFVEEVNKLYNLQNAKILDYAIEPTKPFNINIPRQELIFATVGIILATGIIFVIYYFDRSLKTQEQVEQQLKLPFIGKIRRIHAPKNTKNLSKSAKARLEDELIVKTNPKSRVSEDFRTVRTNLRFSLSDSKTLLITSTTPNEGKSFVASNLAVTFAQSGKNVLLIDTDMHIGRQHEIFKVSNNLGLSNLLADHKSSDYPNYIRDTKIKNLSIIPRGDIPPNPSELLDSIDMDRLLNKTKVKFDYVILDGAPIKDLSDSLILAKKAKRVAIVCHSGQTSIDDINEAKKALENIEASIAGIILNRVHDAKTKSSYYNKYYL